MKSLFLFYFVLLTLTLSQGINLQEVTSAENDLTFPQQSPSNLSFPNPSDLQVFSRILKGLAQEAGLLMQVDLNSCFNDTNIEMLNAWFTSVSKNDWLNIPVLIKEWKSRQSMETNECVTIFDQIKRITQAYGLNGITLGELFTKAFSYISSDYETFAKTMNDISKIYKEGQYEVVGILSGLLIKSITNFNSNPTNIEISPSIPNPSVKEESPQIKEKNNGEQPWEKYINKNKDTNITENNSTQSNDDGKKYWEKYAKAFSKLNNQTNDEFALPKEETNFEDSLDDDIEEEATYSPDPAPDLVYMVFEGLAGEADQLPPRSLRACLNAKSGRIILNFMLDLVGEIHDAGFERVYPTALAFDATIPEKSKRCLFKSKDFQNLKKVYNVNETSLPDFYLRIARFGLGKEFMKLRMTARKILISADMGDFESLGINSGKLLKLVFKQENSLYSVPSNMSKVLV